MPPKRTSTSEASAITYAAIRKLVADSVATALEAQTVMMTIINNPNKNSMSQDVLLTVMNSMSLIGDSVFKEQFDSIKKTHVRTKEQSDSLLDKLNLKSAENEDLKAQIQDKLDLEPLAPRLLQNREVHIEYLQYTQEQADILRGIVEQSKAKQPLDKELDFACRTFTMVGNSCPLTRITAANVVPLKKTTSHSVETQKPELKVYSRKPKNVKNVGSSKKAKIVESKNANHSEPIHTWGSNATDIPSSSSLFMTACPDCSLVSRLQMFETHDREPLSAHELLYYIEGLGHKLFSVGQFCDADLEVAFQKNTCFIRNLDGFDLLSESRDINLYIISLDDMLLAKDGLARGIPRLKFQKDHRCSACSLGKSKKSSHQPKAKDTNQEKLYLLHMDLCGPIRVASINEKKYILGEEINTACYTQNRSLIRLRYNKTPYELLQDVGIKKPLMKKLDD
ncbi:hypothetical protein Tco_1323683, partial [Tanacetum coccineum]